MTTYEDLTECDYFGKKYSKILTAVGWLELGKSYTKGEVSKEFYEKLCEFNKTSLFFASFRGFHRCDFCSSEQAKSSSNILIPYCGKVYVCPKLITHYIEKHSYCPPQEFIEAVYACPPIRSVEYRIKMLRNSIGKIIKVLIKYK